MAFVEVRKETTGHISGCTHMWSHALEHVFCWGQNEWAQLLSPVCEEEPLSPLLWKVSDASS